MKYFSWILSFIEKNMFYIFPLLLLFAYQKSPTKFVTYSNSILGKLLAVIVIFMYLNIDYLYGLLVCLLFILYYQSDFFENMTNIESMTSFERKERQDSCGCCKQDGDDKKLSTNKKNKDLLLENFESINESINENNKDYYEYTNVNAYDNDNNFSGTCNLCKNITDRTCEMCSLLKDVIPNDNLVMDEDFLRMQLINGRETNITNIPEIYNS